MENNLLEWTFGWLLLVIVCAVLLHRQERKNPVLELDIKRAVSFWLTAIFMAMFTLSVEDNEYTTYILVLAMFLGLIGMAFFMQHLNADVRAYRRKEKQRLIKDIKDDFERRRRESLREERSNTGDKTDV